MKQRKNVFFDNIETLDYVIGSKTFSESYNPIYGGVITFGTSKGFTFGLSGLIYKTSGMKKIFGKEQKRHQYFNPLTSILVIFSKIEGYLAKVVGIIAEEDS